MTTSNGGRKVIPSFYSHIVSGWAITCVVADREGQVQRNEKGAISAINMQKATLYPPFIPFLIEMGDTCVNWFVSLIFEKFLIIFILKSNKVVALHPYVDTYATFITK